jgi:hypothetical protein
MKVASLLIAGITISLMLLSTAHAIGTLTLNPRRISPNGMVTITFTSSGNNRIDRIEVEAPDGTLYVKNYNPDVLLSDGQQLIEDFGTGVSGWGSSADTSDEGWYHVVLVGYDGQYEGEDLFDVSRQFFVPEFGLAAAIPTAIGFALYLVNRRKMLATK